MCINCTCIQIIHTIEIVNVHVHVIIIARAQLGCLRCMVKCTPTKVSQLFCCPMTSFIIDLPYDHPHPLLVLSNLLVKKTSVPTMWVIANKIQNVAGEAFKFTPTAWSNMTWSNGRSTHLKRTHTQTLNCTLPY